MAIMPTDRMYEDLDKFFAAKTIVDVDRNTFLICNLRDNIRKITISLVFLRDWDSLESDDFNVVSIKGYGAVFTFPCYWISVPKELCVEYFKYIIEDFYDKEVSTWTSNNESNNNFNENTYMCPGGVINNNNCPNITNNI